MKVYEVLHTVVGEYIGHGLTDDSVETISIFATKESATKEADRLKKENGEEYWVAETDVNE